jgi:hypothetical protein
MHHARAPPATPRCELSIDPAAPKKKGLVKRLISKARHPRSKDGHDQLLGDLVRLRPGGGQVLLDSCSGTWLSELAWDKVRSTGHRGEGPATSTWGRCKATICAALSGACWLYGQHLDVLGSAHGVTARH